MIRAARSCISRVVKFTYVFFLISTRVAFVLFLQVKQKIKMRHSVVVVVLVVAAAVVVLAVVVFVLVL